MANINGTEIDLMPTEGMRAEAQRYRDWKADGRPGGQDAAAARASQILSGDELSPDTVITMAAWFARHEVDKTGEGFSPGEDGYPSPGRVAWAAWGGDPGQTWADAKAERIKALREDRAAVSSLNATSTAPMELRDQLSREQLRRVEAFDYAAAVRAADDPDAEPSRSLEFSFSSEAPVERWFGSEVLSHDAESVDLSRLNDGAPLLWNHNPDQVLGVVERGWLDDKKRRGMVSVRFSRSAFAEEKLADIRDGILRNVSVGYSIGDVMQEKDGPVIATRWQPMEVSVVSIPADAGVGIGRSASATNQAAPAATPSTPKPPVEDNLNVGEVQAAAVTAERARVASITALTRQHGAEDLAQSLIESGASEADAMRQILDGLAKRASQPATPKAAAAQPIASGGSADIGLTDKEARSYSFLRAIRAQAFPNDRAAYEAAAFEREVSEATAKAMGVDARGYLVANEVMKRDLTVGTASAAGDLVFTDARPGSFIELLRNRLALSTLGVQTLTGLQGPVAIPRQTGGATAYWVAEKGEPTESNPTVGQINMTPKTLGAFTEFSRRFILQSSIDAESMVRRELATVMALEIDRAALYGTGSSSQPKGLKFITGINTEDFNADSPTYAELVSMETKVNADNADIGAMSYLTNSTRYGAFKTTSKVGTEAQFVLEPGGTVNGYPVVRSNQVEAGDVFFGVWSQIIMGMWGALDLQVNPYALDKSGGVRVTAFQDVDVAVRYPECFTRGNNTL
jgi:HK97 family phage major capsid protein